MHQPTPLPHTHTHTKKGPWNYDHNAKGTHGGANWVGNRNGEGEKGSRGRRGPTPREWLISMSPHTQFHQRNTTRNIKKSEKYGLQNRKNTCTKSEKYLLRSSRVGDIDIASYPFSPDKYSLQEIQLSN